MFNFSQYNLFHNINCDKFKTMLEIKTFALETVKCKTMYENKIFKKKIERR